MKKLPLFIFLLVLITSCSEIKTNNPIEAYEFWSYSKAPKNITIIQGQYWQSAHWTKEYILYLKLKPSKEWWDQFVEQNQLQTIEENWIKPVDSPTWFEPTEISEMYKMSNAFDQGSRYFKNSASGVCYIYEIQL